MGKGNTYWDRAWSLVDGCTKCSPGCLNCWSEEIYGRFHEDGLISPEKKWTGQILTRSSRLDIPRIANKSTVFAVWNDLAHEAVPDVFRALAYAVMQECRRHTYLVLTKRIHELGYSLRANLSPLRTRPFGIFPGVTVCTQEEADKNIPELLRLKEFFPWMRVWVSLEPILEEISLLRWIPIPSCSPSTAGINAVIIGGESGSPRKVRPIREYWFEKTVNDCRASLVPVFVKQMGTSWAMRNGVWKLGDHQGADMQYWPESLRVRELIWR